MYGYSPKGERLKLCVARNRGKNTTLLASITLEGMGPSMAVEGSSTKEVFEAYLEHILLPPQPPGGGLMLGLTLLLPGCGGFARCGSR